MQKYMLFLLAILFIVSCEKEAFSPEDDFDFTEDGGQDQPDLAGEEGALTLYQVNGDNIAKVQDYSVSSDLLNYQRDESRHQEIWEYVVKLLPANARTRIVEFEVFYGDNDLLGYVAPIDESDLSRWRFALAIEAAGDLSTINFQELFTFVVIHEYAHILTLNERQVDVNGTERSCGNFFTGEGCSQSGSYINRLYQLGWADIYASHDDEDPYATYDRYPDRFVSEYAATNPGEDIAEVFSFFVTQKNRPTGNTIADQKISLMYEFAELVAMRDQIRASVDVDGLSPGSLGTQAAFKAMTGQSKKPHRHVIHHHHAN